MSWRNKKKVNKPKKKPTGTKNVLSKAPDIKIVKDKTGHIINIKSKSLNEENAKIKAAETKNIEIKKTEIKTATIQDLESKEDVQIENLENKEEEIKVTESKEDVETKNAVTSILSKIKFVKIKPEWSVNISPELESRIINFIYYKVKEQNSISLDELLIEIVGGFFETSDFPEELDDENLWLLHIIRKCCYLRIDNDAVILDPPREFPHKLLQETKEMIIAVFDAMDWLVCEIGLGNLRNSLVGDHRTEPGLFNEPLRLRIRDEVKKLTEGSFKLYHQISLLADATNLEGHHLADYNAYALRLYEFQDILKTRNIKVIVNGVRTREVEIDPLGELSLHEQLSLNGQEDRLYDVTIFKVDKLDTWDDGRLVPMTKITWKLINENIGCIFQIIPYRSNFPIILPNDEEKKEEIFPSAELKPLEVKGGGTVTLQDVVFLLSTLNGNFMALNNQLTTNYNTLNSNFSTLNGNFNTLSSNVNNKIGSLEGRFDSLEGRFDSLEGRFDSLEGDFKKLDAKVTTLDNTVNRLNNTVTGLDNRVGSLENRVGLLEGSVNTLRDSVNALKDTVATLNNTVTRLDAKVLELEGLVQRLVNGVTNESLSETITELDTSIKGLKRTVTTLSSTSRSYADKITRIPAIDNNILELKGQYTLIGSLEIDIGKITSRLDNLSSKVSEFEKNMNKSYTNFESSINSQLNRCIKDIESIRKNVKFTRELMHYQREAALASVVTTMLSSILKKNPIHEKLLISLPYASPLLGVRLHLVNHKTAFIQTNKELLGNRIFCKYLKIVQTIASNLEETCKIDLYNTNNYNSIEYNLVSKRDLLQLTDRQQEEQKNNRIENGQKTDQEPGIIIETTGGTCDFSRLGQMIQDMKYMKIENNEVSDPSRILKFVDLNTYVMLHHILQLIRQTYFFQFKTGSPAQIIALESPTFKSAAPEAWKSSWAELADLIQSLNIPFYLLSWEK